MTTPPTTPELFKELHALRKHLRDLQAEIDAGPRVHKTRTNQLQAAKLSLEAAHESIKQLKLKQKNDEGSLKQEEQTLDKYERQLTEAKSSKEFEAKKHEIEMAKSRISELEDAILTAMTSIEEQTANLPNVEQRWADAQKEFAEFEKEAAERMGRLKSESEIANKKLQELEPLLPPVAKSRYDRLVKAYGADALSAIVGRTCQHCHVTITEQCRIDLLSGRFASCPNCDRCLYIQD